MTVVLSIRPPELESRQSAESRPKSAHSEHPPPGIGIKAKLPLFAEGDLFGASAP
ncbi:MAG: hypothetical protein RIQ93_3420, partial [Verrucomicrobiota bacterium]